MYYPVPNVWRSFLVFHPDGYFVSGITGRYSIDLLLPRPDSLNRVTTTGAEERPWHDGDPVVSLRRSVTARVLTAGEMRRLRDRTLQKIQAISSSFPASDLPTIRSTIVPIGRDVKVARDGRIWVPIDSDLILSDASGSSATDREFDVIEPKGVLVGRARGIPQRCTILAILGDDVWCTDTNSDGVPVVIRYHVTWTR
jgi:hypothetical protein